MALIIKKTPNTVIDTADFIASLVSDKIKNGKVLLALPGGSSIEVGVKIFEILSTQDLHNLTVMLTDERYGKVGHPDSNFFQLEEKGFNPGNSRTIPVLTGGDMESETKRFGENLKNELEKADYKIGLFGIGADGHTAGMLPGSGAVTSEDYAIGYNTETFSRITMTAKAIEKLDEAVVYAVGEEKRPVIESLKENIDIIKQPAQILKKVPLLTIFTDYMNNMNN